MTDQPNYGQRFETYEWIACYRHPREQAISKCKRCQRDTCLSCTIPTEVSTICAECAGEASPRLREASARPQLVVNNSAKTGFSTQKLARRFNWGSWLGTGSLSSVTNVLVLVITAVSVAGFLSNGVVSYLAYYPLLTFVHPWRIVTVMLVHGGFLHLLFNMYSLYLVGNPLERTLGVAKYLGILFASVMGGSLASFAWMFLTHEASWAVGASGGIFGLFAAIFILQRQSGVDARSMAVLLGLNLVISFVFPGIAWQAHVGGMLTGGFLTWLLYKFALPRPGKTPQEVQFASRLIFVVFFGLVGLLLLVGQLWVV